MDSIELDDPNLEREIAEFDECENEHICIFGRSKRISCIVHSIVCCLRKIVDDCEEFRTVKQAAFALVSSFRHSNLRTEKLTQLTNKTLISPANTRWLYTFYVLDRLLIVQEGIEQVIKELGCSMIGLSAKDWSLISNIRNFLQPFAAHCTYLEVVILKNKIFSYYK